MEIERKFMLSEFPRLEPVECCRVEQGYLSLIPEVRIRSVSDSEGERYKLTLKGEGTLSRTEVELRLEPDAFNELKGMLTKPMICKEYRAYLLEGGLKLECNSVDSASETGFMYAEVEFESEKQANEFVKPEFLGRELTYIKGMKMRDYWEDKERFAGRLRSTQGTFSPEYVLASSSPRRRELLEQAQVSFEVITADTDESTAPGLSPEEVVLALSERKAQAVFREHPERAVIAADTVVSLEGEIFGKPKDEEDAARMLASLSGKTHSVYTGVCIMYPGGELDRFAECTRVEFLPLSKEMITAYISSGEPMDKAGAYAIQGLGAKFIRQISGDYNTVVGLPLARVCASLEQHR